MSQPAGKRESIPTVAQIPLTTPTQQKKTGFDVDICGRAELGEGDGVGLELNEDNV